MIARPLRLMALFTRVSLLNVAAYRFDMAVRMLVSVLHLVADLVGIWTIFSNTREVAGWRAEHMLVVVGVFRIVAGGIRMSIVPNMRRVLEDIMDGTLDFVLLRPVNAQFLVSIREFVVWRVVDVALGAAIAGYGCYRLNGTLPVGSVLLFVVMLGAGLTIVYCFWLMLATLCFWFVRIQNIEMVFWNVFEAGRFPITVYPAWVQWTLTYLIPLAFIITFPAAAWTGDPSKMSPSTAGIAWLMAGGMFVLSSWFWHAGLRRYSGASA
jgi:ABC-2 type transport system permease protein